MSLAYSSLLMGESCSEIDFRLQYDTGRTDNVTNRADTSGARSHPPQLVLGDGAGVHECLRDDREHGVHVVRRLHVEYELGVLDDVDPETQREAAEGGGGGGSGAASRDQTPTPRGLLLA